MNELMSFREYCLDLLKEIADQLDASFLEILPNSRRVLLKLPYNINFLDSGYSIISIPHDRTIIFHSIKKHLQICFKQNNYHINDRTISCSFSKQNGNETCDIYYCKGFLCSDFSEIHVEDFLRETLIESNKRRGYYYLAGKLDDIDVYVTPSD